MCVRACFNIDGRIDDIKGTCWLLLGLLAALVSQRTAICLVSIYLCTIIYHKQPEWHVSYNPAIPDYLTDTQHTHKQYAKTDL